MRQIITLLIVATVGWGLSDSTARAQTSNTIMGTVYDSQRQPVQDLWVEALDEANSQLGRTRTDASGRYSFNRLSSGIILIRVAGNGIVRGETQRVELTPATGGSGSTIETVDFYLKPFSESGTATKAAAFAQEVPPAARTAYDDGVKLLSSDAQGGLAKLKEAIGLFPDYYAALSKYGLECVKQGQFEPAVGPLTKAIAVNPKGQDSYYALGVAQYQLKKLPESAETLKQMVKLDPQSPNTPHARYFLGMALVKTGKPTEAEPELKQAYEQGRTNIPTDVHMALAQIYGNSKRYKEAADQLELFLKETPDARDKERIKGLISQLRAKAK